MFLWTVLLALLLVFSSVSAQHDGLAAQIREAISSKQVSGPQLGLLHLQLAMHLQQQWFTKQINGNKLGEAVDSYNEAFRLMRQSGEVRKSVEIAYHRGVLLKVMGRGDEAIASYKTALEYELSTVDIAAILYNLADAEVMMGHLDAAIGHFRRALGLVPCKTERYYGYVMALKEQNTFTTVEWAALVTELQEVDAKCEALVERKRRKDESDTARAVAAQKKSKKSDKQTKKKSEKRSESESVASLKSAQPLSEAEVEVDLLDTDEIFEDNFLPSHLFSDTFYGLDVSGVFPSKESDLAYAIYIAADKAKQRQVAWDALVRANTAEKAHRSGKFDAQQAILAKNNTVNIFTESLLDSFPDVSAKSSRVPIFIIGMMRSGSTLIETMLDAHPQVWGMGEDSVFNANLTALRDALVDATAQGSSAQMQRVLLEFGKNTVQGMRRMVLTSQGDAAGQKKSTQGQKMKHIVDKMLFNYRNIGFIHAVFPEAVIIHMVRDPLDTIFSCYRQKFDDQGLEWSLDIEDLVLQYALYLQYMQHFRTLLPGRVLDVRYEELIDKPEATLREIIVKRLRLPWNDEVLRFHESQRVVLTNSQSQVRQSLYKHSVGGWRAYADQLQPIVDAFRRHLPALRKQKALPFADLINWEMDRNFDYDRLIEDKPSAASDRNPLSSNMMQFTVPRTS